MRGPRTFRLIAFALVCGLALTVHTVHARKEQRQRGIREKAKDALQRLYRVIQGQKEAASHGECSSWPLPHIEKVT